MLIARKGFQCSMAMVILLALSMAALAQQNGRAGFSYGIDVELLHDDNIYRAESGEESSLILEASPFITATLMNKGNSYQLGYRLNYAEYFSSSADSYNDHEFDLGVNHRFTSRQALQASLSHKLLTEERGTGFSEEPNDLVRSPDDFEATRFDLTYLIGAPTARSRVELNARRDLLDFDSSYVDDTRDYRSDLLGVLFRYRVGARTDILAEYRKQFVRFDNTPLDANNQAINLDSEEDYYLGGIAWELSAKTRGEVRVGQSEREYDDGRFSDSGTHWEAEVEWQRRSYSVFVLKTGRESLETFGTGRYIDVKRHSLTWNHAWRGRISSRLEAGLMDDSYRDSNRRDDQFYWQAILFYEPATWLKMSGGYTYWENDSNFSPVDYERNVFFVRASVEL